MASRRYRFHCEGETIMSSFRERFGNLTVQQAIELNIAVEVSENENI